MLVYDHRMRYCMTMAPRQRRTLVSDRISVEAFLADSVAAPGDGKLYVQGGGWNMLNTPLLPIRQARIGIGILVKVPYVLANGEQHDLTLHLEDADHRRVGMGAALQGAETPDGQLNEIRAQFAVGRPVGIEAGDEQILPLALNLDGILFERAGVYVFVIGIDAEEERAKRLRFKINLTSQPRLVAG